MRVLNLSQMTMESDRVMNQTGLWRVLIVVDLRIIFLATNLSPSSNSYLIKKMNNKMRSQI